MSRAWAVIDLDAVAHNVAHLRRVAGGAQLCAVVKADAYGHGAEPVARTALAAGATRLAVAHVAEGVALRRAGVEAPIWLLAEPELDELGEARHHRLEPVVYSAQAVDAAASASAATAQADRWPVHLKLDTGMARVGAPVDQAVALARRITAAPGLRLGSVLTHLATADEPWRSETATQLARFDRALAALAAAGVDVPLVHAANTAATLAHPAARRDVVRCGIGLHGIAPGPAVDAGGLHPAMSLHTRVAFTKRVPAGTAVSYGLRASVDRPTTLATLPVGYADGFRRGRWDRGAAVLIGGVRRPVVGVVTMDQVVVDCGDDAVAPGDDVVLLGRQGDEVITVQEWAEQAGTIGYEVVCGIGPRVERRYVGGPA